MRKPKHSLIFTCSILASLCLVAGALNAGVAYSGTFTLDNQNPGIITYQANTIDTLYTGQNLSFSFHSDETHLRRAELQLFDGEDNLLATYITGGTDSLLSCTIPNHPEANASLILELVDDYGNASAVWVDNSFQIVPDRPLPPAGLSIQGINGSYHLTWQAAHMLSGTEHPVDYYLVCKSTSPDPDDLRAYRIIGITTATSFTEITPRIPRFAFYRVIAGKLGTYPDGHRDR